MSYKLFFTNTVRALKHKNYKLFFIGNGISLIGTWMTRIAISWLVYRLTGSAVLLGAIMFAGQIPTFLFNPLAGVMVDRMSRKKILLITQIFSMLHALLLAALTLSGYITIWQLFVLAVFQGIVNAFDIPARQSFLFEIIPDKKDLGNAIALNSSVFNAARFIGPSIAGIIIGFFGEGVCFLIDGLSYFAVLVSLYKIKVLSKKQSRKKEKISKDIFNGFKYALNNKIIRNILSLLALTSLVGIPYAVLMPVFVKDILKLQADSLGFLMGASGLGSVAASLLLASRKEHSDKMNKSVFISALIFGIVLSVLSFTDTFLMALAVMPIAGGALIFQLAASNTMLQFAVDDNHRGRVMSFYSMAFMGMAPLGSLISGIMAENIGVPHTFLIGGFLACMGAFGFNFISNHKSNERLVHKNW
ncbi:MAG: MFS transporter [Spirochaetia bacterium]|nr:MFS transporter [Spirochaetia bacterium]